MHRSNSMRAMTILTSGCLGITSIESFFMHAFGISGWATGIMTAATVGLLYRTRVRQDLHVPVAVSAETISVYRTLELSWVDREGDDASIGAMANEPWTTVAVQAKGVIAWGTQDFLDSYFALDLSQR